MPQVPQPRGAIRIHLQGALMFNKTKDRCVFTFGPQGTEFVHPSVMDAYVARSDKSKLKPVHREEIER